MASNASRGVPPLPATLIRPTPPESSPELPPANDEVIETTDGQGRGAADTRTAKGRRRRIDRGTAKPEKRGLYLTPGVWQRLQLEAIRKGTSVSAVAGDTLERNLPRLRIEKD